MEKNTILFCFGSYGKSQTPVIYFKEVGKITVKTISLNNDFEPMEILHEQITELLSYGYLIKWVTETEFQTTK